MEIFNLGQNDKKIMKNQVCRNDSLSNSDANIVSNFQVDTRKNRVGNRDSVRWVRTWVQGEGIYGENKGGPQMESHRARNRFAGTRRTYTSCKHGGGVVHVVAIRNGVAAQQKVG